MHQELQNRIKEYILVNKLKPGSPIPTEAQVAERLGVSRAVVREALRSLETLGVIYSRQGDGRYVSEFNLEPILQNLPYSMLFNTEKLQEILEVRERLETSYIADAIAKMNPDTLNELRTLVDKMHQKAEAGESFLMEEDPAFHRAIYRATGNQFLLKLLDIFWDVYKNLRTHSLSIEVDVKVQAKNHEAIIRAIEAGDVELAQRCVIEHFKDINRRVLTLS